MAVLLAVRGINYSEIQNEVTVFFFNVIIINSLKSFRVFTGKPNF